VVGRQDRLDRHRQNLRQYAATKTPAAARQDLTILKLAMDYWHAEYGPLQSTPSYWLPERNPPRERWLTRQ
jgi:hypothetical protein